VNDYDAISLLRDYGQTPLDLWAVTANRETAVDLARNNCCHEAMQYLESLLKENINVVAIHNHMTKEATIEELSSSYLKYKVCVSGSAETEHCPPGTVEKAMEIGRLIAQHNMVLVTGATTVTGQLNVTGYIVSDTALQAPAVAVAGQVNAGSVIATTSLLQGGVLGFYGTAGQAKPTVSGSRGSNAALTSLLSALATLGLIVNSSS
jgi:hypothetical protein